MTLKLVATSKFKKEYKKAKKRGLPMNELQTVLSKLCTEQPLEERHHDHALSRNYVGFANAIYVQTGFLSTLSTKGVSS